jgi:predicted hotdog family 3-hydroxylacyl-ACP dehydratase
VISSRCAELLPHVGDAVLLEQVVAVHDDGLTAAMTVRPGTAFSQPDGSLAPWAAPEIMAQAVSAFANLENRQGVAPALGLLLGVRDLHVSSGPFPVGAQLQVEVTESTRDQDGSGVFNCRILRDDAVVAEGKLTVLQPDDPRTTLGEQIS